MSSVNPSWDFPRNVQGNSPIFLQEFLQRGRLNICDNMFTPPAHFTTIAPSNHSSLFSSWSILGALSHSVQSTRLRRVIDLERKSILALIFPLFPFFSTGVLCSTHPPSHTDTGGGKAQPNWNEWHPVQFASSNAPYPKISSDFCKWRHSSEKVAKNVKHLPPRAGYKNDGKQTSNDTF